MRERRVAEAAALRRFNGMALADNGWADLLRRNIEFYR
jgi:hypothetical protein